MSHWCCYFFTEELAINNTWLPIIVVTGGTIVQLLCPPTEMEQELLYVSCSCEQYVTISVSMCITAYDILHIFLIACHTTPYFKAVFHKLRHLVSTSSCSFWVKPLTLFPVEAWPINVMTFISGVWRFNMAAISCTLSRNDEKIITRVLTSRGLLAAAGPDSANQQERRQTGSWNQREGENPFTNC